MSGHLHLPRALAAIAFASLVAPWLNPFAPGPSAAAGPLLFGWLCASIALGLGVWRQPHRVAAAWLAAALVSAGIGLVQYFGLTQVFGGWANYTEPGTAYGNLRQRNQFATLLSIGVMAVLFLAARGLRARLAVPALVLLGVASAASTSRTGVLQLLFVTLLTLAWGGGERMRLARLCAVVLGAYAVAAAALPWLLPLLTGHAAPGLLDRVSAGPGCSSRMVLWSNVLELVAQRPWAGWGVGELDYAHFAHLYAGPRFCDILDNAHNLPLHLAVELGVPAAAALLVAMAWLVLRARPWQERDPARQLAWGVLVALGLHSLVEYPLWYAPFQLALLLALLMLAPAREPGAAARAVGRALAFAVLPAALAYAAWDYHRISQLYLSPEARHPAYREQTLEKAQASVLFARQVRFAQLSVMPLTRANAREVHALALDMLHFSPEPKVAEAVIDSAMVLGDEAGARWHMARYRAAFPQEYQAWLDKPLLGRELE